MRNGIWFDYRLDEAVSGVKRGNWRMLKLKRINFPQINLTLSEFAFLNFHLTGAFFIGGEAIEFPASLCYNVYNYFQIGEYYEKKRSQISCFAVGLCCFGSLIGDPSAERSS